LTSPLEKKIRRGAANNIAYLGGPRLEVPDVLLFGRESVGLPVNPDRFARALPLQQ
jgi:hypothetical protein